MVTLGLLSACGSGITGEVIHVDCGYHTVGMLNINRTKEIGEMLIEG